MNLLIRIHHTNVYRHPSGAVVWSGGMEVDADGGRHAYHPDGCPPGLDRLANAGHAGNWWGIATDPGGRPHVQSSTDPAPGFYVSTTALADPDLDWRNPAKYVDAETVPFIVLPEKCGFGRMGDVGFAYHPASGDSSFFVCADIGPAGQIGEGSIQLAKNLSIPDSPVSGGVTNGVTFVVFDHSSQGWQSWDAYFAQAAALTSKFGGVAELKALSV